ncbi:MAG: response regulator [Bacteroidota bacterium]|nr:response regulator [Bacteroidota bacterium]
MTKKILFIDDSKSVREVLQFTLEENGYDVLIGINGKDGLAFLNGQKIDLIITDLHMPEMDGISFIKKARKIKKYQHIPILFLTTETQLEKKLEAKKSGATGWITKPFVAEKLLKTINKVIR